MQDIQFYIPTNLDLESLIFQYDQSLVKHIDKFHYVINRLYLTRFLDKRYSSTISTPLSFDQNPVSVSGLSLYHSNTSIATSILPFHDSPVTSSLSHIHSYGVEPERHAIDQNDNIRVIDRSEMKYSDLDRFEKKEVKREFIPLNAKRLRIILTCEFTRAIMNALIQVKVIETDNQYISGAKSKGYRLTTPYRSVTFKRVPVKDRRFHNKLVRLKETEIQSLSDLHQQIYQNMYSFIFDWKSAESLLEKMNHNTEDYLSVKVSIDRIIDRDFFFTTDEKTGRIFHNYCNLKKEFRRFILDDSRKPLVEIDISNSQPFFLSLLLKENHIKNQDSLQYIRLTEEGNLYDYISEKYNLEREYVKKQMLTLFFCKNHWKFRLKDIFIKEFPSVYAFIEERKREKYSQLAIDLQKSEAEVMISTIGSLLLEREVKFITVHDSLIVSERDAVTVLGLMEQTFKKKCGVQPHFRITRS